MMEFASLTFYASYVRPLLVTARLARPFVLVSHFPSCPHFESGHTSAGVGFSSARAATVGKQISG
jgi:hypothetical protein